MNAAPLPPRAEVLRRRIVPRNPFQVESVPFLSRLYRTAYLPDRGASKLVVAKPAKLLFRLLMALGARGEGRFGIDLPDGRRRMSFNARNTQFGAIYQQHFQPVYEPEISALLDLLVADNDGFLDVGANWGWYSLLVASRPGFAGHIHAFEPMPDTFADLAGVVREAGLADRVTCHALALGDRDGAGAMTIPGGLQSGFARLSGTAASRSASRSWTPWRCRRPE